MLSRGGFELNEIWEKQRSLVEADARLRELERRMRSGDAGPHEVEALHRQQVRTGRVTPAVTTALYQHHARRRDAAEKKYRESGYEDREAGSDYTKHRDSTAQIAWDASRHHGDDAPLLLTPHTKNQHNATAHVRDLLRASGSKGGEDLREPVRKQEDGTHEGRIGSSFYSGLRKEVGERFDKAFKHHYPKSIVSTGDVYVDPKQTDRNGRRITIHPDDMGHAGR